MPSFQENLIVGSVSFNVVTWALDVVRGPSQHFINKIKQFSLSLKVEFWQFSFQLMRQLIGWSRKELVIGMKWVFFIVIFWDLAWLLLCGVKCSYSLQVSFPWPYIDG